MIQGTQLSAFLKNHPRVPLKLCDVISKEGINILAMSIQNAKDYVMELYRAREKTGRRIAPAANYSSILKDSEEYSVIRLVVDKAEEAKKILADADYIFDLSPVLQITLENRPGSLGELAGLFARANVNIDYVYGSAREEDKKAVFIVHIQNIEDGMRLLKEAE